MKHTTFEAAKSEATPMPTIYEAHDDVSSHQRIKAIALIERLSAANEECMEFVIKSPTFIWAAARSYYQDLETNLQCALTDNKDVDFTIRVTEICLSHFEAFKLEQEASIVT